MYRTLLLIAVTLLLSGCDRFVRSQQTPPPQRPPVADTAQLNDRITRSRQTAITRAVEAVSPAVVSISVTEVQQVRDPFANFRNDPFFEYFFGRRPRTRARRVESIGSGFVISPDGYMATNDHVAGNAAQIEVLFPDGRTTEARLVGSDPPSDLALLKIDTDESLPYLAFDTTSAPLVGEWVIALGNPFGLFEATEPTVTVGVVSATDRDLSAGRNGRLYRDMIQTDAAINQGNSGGPLVNAAGEVIGVNTAIYTESGGSIGIGFAVPARRAVRILDELRTSGTVDRSYYTGMYVNNVDERVARALDLDRTRGVLVRDLDPNSPAAEAGVQPYDVIVAIEGEPIDTRDDYVARIYDFRPGDRVQVRLIRDGTLVELTLRIGRQQD
jgi:serine protease Do